MITKIGNDGNPEEVRCNWCGSEVTEKTAQAYGPNFHICDPCTLKFGARASVIIEGSPELAEQTGDQIRRQLADAPQPEQAETPAQTEAPQPEAQTQ